MSHLLLEIIHIWHCWLEIQRLISWTSLQEGKKSTFQLIYSQHWAQLLVNVYELDKTELEFSNEKETTSQNLKWKEKPNCQSWWRGSAYFCTSPIGTMATKMKVLILFINLIEKSLKKNLLICTAITTPANMVVVLKKLVDKYLSLSNCWNSFEHNQKCLHFDFVANNRNNTDDKKSRYFGNANQLSFVRFPVLV